MNAAAMLVVLIANQGYFLSDADARVSLAWAGAGQVARAEVVWELAAGGARLAGGTVPMHPRDGVTITIRTPAVRTRTTLAFSYRLVEQPGARTLDRGHASLHVFPRHLLGSAAGNLRGRRLIVVDREAGELSTVLKRAGVTFDAVPSVSALQARAPDLVIVAPDALKRSPFEQAPLAALAASGAGVFLFQQSAAEHLLGYPLSKRKPTTRMTVEDDHPLLHGLQHADVESWLASPDAAIPAIQLPPDEAAQEVISWRPEAPAARAAREPAPLDALLASKTTGRGRVVMCQLPLGSFETDPRSQLLLRNALEYLLTRPQPTPPPSQRRPEPQRQPAWQPEIPIPSGARP